MKGAPIPGQSLTTPPKNFPWERPPEIVDPEEAIQMHITRLSNPDMLDSLLNMLEVQELDVQTVTKGILRGAVGNGIHSIDVALIVAPVVHEFIKQAATAAGLEVEDGFEDKKAKEQERQAVVSARARKMLKQMNVKPEEVVQEVPAQETVVEKPAAPKGLMARGNF